MGNECGSTVALRDEQMSTLVASTMREVFARLDSCGANTISNKELQDWISGGEPGEAVGSLYYLPAPLRNCSLDKDLKGRVWNALKAFGKQLSWDDLVAVVPGLEKHDKPEAAPVEIRLSWLLELFWRLDSTGTGVSVLRSDYVKVLNGESVECSKLPPQFKLPLKPRVAALCEPEIDKVNGRSKFVTALTSDQERVTWYDLMQIYLTLPAPQFNDEISDDDDPDSLFNEPDQFVLSSRDTYKLRTGTRASKSMQCTELLELLDFVHLEIRYRKVLCCSGVSSLQDLKKLSAAQMDQLGLPQRLNAVVKNWTVGNSFSIKAPIHVPHLCTSRKGFLPVVADFDFGLSQSRVEKKSASVQDPTLQTDSFKWRSKPNE